MTEAVAGVDDVAGVTTPLLQPTATAATTRASKREKVEARTREGSLRREVLLNRARIYWYHLYRYSSSPALWKRRVCAGLPLDQATGSAPADKETRDIGIRCAKTSCGCLGRATIRKSERAALALHAA
jgi:hypothetical protein